MKKPTIEMIPNRAALRSDAVTDLTVLIRIIPPAAQLDSNRPPLNLGLVLDRSGSMQGSKLDHAKKAATYAVQQLLATDRVAVTIFDDEVETIVPSTLAGDNPSIATAISGVECDGSTALHAGWVEGGIQVSRHLETDRLNRVLLLTDGHANVGETNADRIASDVRELSTRGVSTSTLGLGRDYNEDLIEAMAKSGDGNYYWVESSKQLPDIFASELRGLMATVGQTVSLGFEPQRGAEVTDLPNDLERNNYGRLQLPNLIAGSPVKIVARLTVPAAATETDVCFVRLAWTNPKTKHREVIREPLSLPVVDSSAYEQLQENPHVTEEAGILEVARIRQRAITEIETGDLVAARTSLQQGRHFLACMAPSPVTAAELNDLDTVDMHLERRDVSSASKSAKFDNYRKRRSRS